MCVRITVLVAARVARMGRTVAVIPAGTAERNARAIPVRDAMNGTQAISASPVTEEHTDAVPVCAVVTVTTVGQRTKPTWFVGIVIVATHVVAAIRTREGDGERRPSVIHLISASRSSVASTR